MVPPAPPFAPVPAAESAVASLAFSGAVLAGGRSSRFGSDKCRHRYRGRSLLAHALSSLRDASDLMVVGRETEPDSVARGVADLLPGHGPMSGIHAALLAARHPWVAIVACDMPFVGPELWRKLLEQSDGVQIVIPQGPSGAEPLAGVYHVDLAPTLQDRLARDDTSLHALLPDVPTRIVAWSALRDDVPEKTFMNANRPGDLP